MGSGYNFLFFVFPFIFGMLGLFFLVLGLRGIVTRKPFLISSRWLLGLTLVFGLPVLLNPFWVTASNPLSQPMGAIASV
jgi:hypothetical protein